VASHSPLALIAELESAPGSVGLCWLGQAGFLIRYGGTTLLIDAFLSPRDGRLYEASMSPGEFTDVDVVLCTHEHVDHLDAPALPGRPSGSLEEAPAGPDDILATETLADLYVQQGFGDEARAIYEELVRSDPERADLQAKLDALQEPPGEGAAAAPFPGSEGPGTLADILEAWLLAARSRRAERQDGRR